ncbi:MAG: rhodanese-like domain-containing protein [Gemmatimonadota bacterium]|nr:rhodanese-like domain-containing protein [Gemmatimonadota bacterium]
MSGSYGSRVPAWLPSRGEPGGLGGVAAVLVWLAVAGCGGGPRTDAEKLAVLNEMAADVDARFPKVEQLSVDQVGRLLEANGDGLVLVDVRENHEREVSRIPGSITAEEFEADPSRYSGAIVVAYCTIGARSSAFAKKHTSEGRPVANLRGSILAWTHAGGPLVGEEGPTTRVHVYGERWNLAPERYEAVW